MDLHLPDAPICSVPYTCKHWIVHNPDNKMSVNPTKVGGRRYRTVNVGYVSVVVGAKPWASLLALAVMYNACDFAWAYAQVTGYIAPY